MTKPKLTKEQNTEPEITAKELADILYVELGADFLLFLEEYKKKIKK